MPQLFDRLKIKDVELKNRVAVSPMCQYSAADGMPNDWHLVHLGARAAGGSGLVIAEATAISPDGRISHGDAGIWNDIQADRWARIAAFARQFTAFGMQIGHAGRKASANRPWEGDNHIDQGDPSGWDIVGPSPLAFGGNLPKVPRELTTAEIVEIQNDFVAAAKRVLDAGCDWLELHFAHGYLPHSFLSPIANKRTDEYGGSLENRSRFIVETLTAVRAIWPERLPLTARLGVTDFHADGLVLEEAIELARRLKEEGLDLLDVSLGFNSPDVNQVPWGPAFMAPIAARIKQAVEMPVAVGWKITEPEQADEIVRNGQADLIMLAHAMLGEPHWAYNAAKSLGIKRAHELLPQQYQRAMAGG